MRYVPTATEHTTPGALVATPLASPGYRSRPHLPRRQQATLHQLHMRRLEQRITPALRVTNRAIFAPRSRLTQHKVGVAVATAQTKRGGGLISDLLGGATVSHVLGHGENAQFRRTNDSA